MTRDRLTTRTTTAAAMAAVLVLTLGSAAPAGVVTLRDRAERTGPQVTLDQIADLTGDDAVALGTVVVNGSASRITIADVRRALTEKNVHWGHITLRGASSVTIGAAAPAKPPVVDTKTSDADGGAVANPAPVITTAGEEDSTHQTLRQRVVAWIIEQVGADESDVKVAFENESDALLDVSVGSSRLAFESLTRDALGRMPIDVRRYNADGTTTLHRLQATVQLRRQVVMSRRNLGRGQTIMESDVEIKEQWADSSLRQPLRDVTAAVGQRAASTIRSGHVVFADDVKGQAVIKRGQLVTIRCVSGGLVLKTVARANEDGEIGATIAVQNDKTREVFSVRVTGPQEGLVVVDEDKPALANQEAGK